MLPPRYWLDATGLTSRRVIKVTLQASLNAEVVPNKWVHSPLQLGLKPTLTHSPSQGEGWWVEDPHSYLPP